MICGSEEVSLWLGGSIGSLYHCTDCHYVGPIVLETDAQQPFADQFVSFWDLVEGGSFWSETGISNQMLFQMRLQRAAACSASLPYFLSCLPIIMRSGCVSYPIALKKSEDCSFHL